MHTFVICINNSDLTGAGLDRFYCIYKFPFIKKCIGLHLAVFKVRDNELRGHFLDPEETFVLHVNKSCGLNI